MRCSPTFRLGSAFLFLWLFAGPAAATSPGEEWSGGSPSEEEDKPRWQEQRADLPAYPDARHYIQVPLDLAGSALQMFIDEPALSVGADGVVRYTLLLRSSRGSENLFYEGIRCATREWRSYAYGASAGKWQALGDTPWRVLRDQGVERYRLELYQYYLCDPAIGPRSRDDMVRRMRYGVHTGEDAGIY